jgi:hypothetical protein
LQPWTPLVDLIACVDIMRSYCALLAQGKSDFIVIAQYRGDDFFRTFLDNKDVPSEGTMRQRMDEYAERFLAPVFWASIEYLERTKAHSTALYTGHIPLDLDGFVMDNSGNKKENFGSTYQKVDGYLAFSAYLGTEGWMVNQHILPGCQHPQNGFIANITLCFL